MSLRKKYLLDGHRLAPGKRPDLIYGNRTTFASGSPGVPGEPVSAWKRLSATGSGPMDPLHINI